MAAETETAALYLTDPFLKTLEKLSPALDFPLIKRALDFSQQAHRNQFRKSGAPFQTHAVEVAKILAELKMDSTTICAGLLHDVIEDTPITYEDLKKEFNDTIADLVEGVTKIGSIPLKSTEEVQVENYKKMLLSTAKDLRVIIIKFADRLHNLRTLKYLPSHKIELIAKESLNVYVPLAHRLGMAKIRWEMEDLAFKHLYPADYEFLLNKFEDHREKREESITTLVTAIGESMEKAGIHGKFSGRSKHLYSIYNKMKSGRSFDEIYDLFAVRIVVQDTLDCYKALGVIHSLWIPVQNRFKDYIATPKSNMYQSLHTTVVGPRGKMVEIQVRTEEMDLIAEDGVAAHWMYKERINRFKNPENISWLKNLIDLQTNLTDPDEFMDFFKIDLFRSEIFVFTPKGDLIQLPKGSSVLDFAFNVHTDLGYQCVAGKVNGKAVPFNTSLKSGDTVEIIRAKTQRPSPGWLHWVKTSKARRDIRYWLKQKSSEYITVLGKELFGREISSLGFQGDYSEKLRELFPHFKHSDLDPFYHAIGNGDIPIIQVMDRLFPEKKLLKKESTSLFKRLIPKKKRPLNPIGLVLNAPDSVAILLAKCCQPLPGDKIVGYVVKDKGIEIHRHPCPRGMMHLEKSELKIEVGWDSKVQALFKTKLQVLADDRTHLLSDIALAISNTETNILHAHVEQDGKRSFHTYLVELHNRRHLNEVVRSLRKIKNVKKISREMIFDEKDNFE